MNRHPTALQHRVLPPEDYELDDPSSQPLPAPAVARAFLIGMRAAYGMPTLQQMRVLMVMPGHRVHPTAPRERIAIEPLQGGGSANALRPIGGDVLRDAQGRLFERRADHSLRALGAVFSGARGQLYEQYEPHEHTDERADIEDVEPRQRAEAESPVDETPPAPREPRRSRAAAARERPTPRAARAVNPAARSPQPATVRALLPAAGQWVRVRAVEFAALLQGQLAQPQRIAADYEIGAWLQVFESDADLEPGEAAHRIFGDERMSSRLAPWTAALAQRLGVTLDARSADGARERAAPGRIAAGQRFFSLTVAGDPTAQAEPGSPPSDAAPRTTVPPALQAALPPRLPREQAIAQLQHAQTPGWWQRWRRHVGHAARAGWQQQLAGRSLDEQLWAVPPPLHGLGDARVREWVTRTLRLAGYDAPRMVDEWEIFWRCRGATD